MAGLTGEFNFFMNIFFRFCCYLFALGPEHLFELVLLCAVGPRNDTSLLVNLSAWTRPLVLSTSSLMLKWCFCSQLFMCFHSCLFICVNDDGVKSESSFFLFLFCSCRPRTEPSITCTTLTDTRAAPVSVTVWFHCGLWYIQFPSFTFSFVPLLPLSLLILFFISLFFPTYVDLFSSLPVFIKK